MKVDLIDWDFCRMHQVGRVTVMPNANGKVNRGQQEVQPRQILVKLGIRHKIMRVQKTLKDLTGKTHRIYVNEDLTRERVQVTKNVHTAIKDTWVDDGKICLKLNDDSVRVVTTLAKLQEFWDQ